MASRPRCYPMDLYPRSPCGERRDSMGGLSFDGNFYPRSPCGERPPLTSRTKTVSTISIHALLAESDQKRMHQFSPKTISIHALLAESDPTASRRKTTDVNFYPRSPCGERQMSGATSRIFRAFLSTLSLRRATPAEHHANSQQEFLSTLSLRRATPPRMIWKPATGHFYPRSPCGERLAVMDNIIFVPRFLSTLSLRRATIRKGTAGRINGNFYPRSPCGERRFERCRYWG